MIPPILAEAAAKGGWGIVIEHRAILSRALWVTLIGPRGAVDIKYDRWRHASARAYRGRALTAILTGQRAIAKYLTT